MTDLPEDPHPGGTDRGTPSANGARQRRDRNLRISRRLTRSLVAVSAALVLGFTVLAAATTGAFNGAATPSTPTGQSTTTTTDDAASNDSTPSGSDTTGNDTTTSGSTANGQSSSAPSATNSAPATTSGAS